MTLSTTPTLEGNPIRQYLGVVTAESIVGANFVKDFMANVRDFFGGRSGAYEGVLIEAREIVLKELEERASRMGANAVVGISFDYEAVGGSGSMLMVVASGTAVVV
ncbi:MAG: heavy metal-binding domain-containing protein [Alloprevotella sp.]|nr:heavy metal-binding domain-containing protein [Bacteroidales bacterium]MDY2975533.1 heavy metal-binding domain-containing protein [Alloprevotella sp.]MCI7167729.1 heavy metal-binding domain-containing protein [Bacteroidales bacterium]MDD6500885.1 heavy metal-binding domain-containing protein [Bacteroidales bacterium]MDD6538264.1 heavy metal-binding domain-containing protein [Bacteroidales bacterium]